MGRPRRSARLAAVYFNDISGIFTPRQSASYADAYEEFVKTSIQKGWSPSDPVDKLYYSCRQFGLIYNTSQLGVANMLNNEFAYVLNVLRTSPKRQIDLTELIFESLENIHRVTYRVLKQSLQEGTKRVMTKDEAQAISAKHAYESFNALLRLVPFAAEVKMKDTSVPHITIDINRRIGRGNRTLLELALHFRLTRVYANLLLRGAHTDNLYDIVVRSGDDDSLSLLLQYRVPLPPNLASLHQYAIDMNYTTIAAKLQAILTQSGKYEDLFVPPFKNEFWPIIPTSASAPTPVTYASQDGEYIDLGFAPPIKYDIAEDAAAPIDITSQCRVEVIDATAALPPAAALMRKFEHAPVMLHGLLNASKIREEWSLSKLKEHSGYKRVRMSRIPYGKHFGDAKSEVPISLFDYVEKMQQYTLSTQRWIYEHLGHLAPISVVKKRLIASDRPSIVPLNQFGGLDILHRNGTKAWFPKQYPYYVFDNEVLDQSPDSFKHFFSFESYPPTPSPTNDSSIYLEELIQASLAQHIRHSPKAPPASIKRQFFLGPALSGAPFHHHGAAVNAVVYGRKLWALLPPGRDLYSKVHPLEWSVGVRNASYRDPTVSSPSLWELFPYVADGMPCVLEQKAGDVLYIPAHWSHQKLLGLRLKLSCSGFYKCDDDVVAQNTRHKCYIQTYYY